jgi:hypothetical protein
MSENRAEFYDFSAHVARKQGGYIDQVFAPSLDADIADGTEATNWLCIAANYPEKLRSYLDCLIGMAGDPRTLKDNDGWFEATDNDVGERVRLGQLPALDGTPEENHKALSAWSEGLGKFKQTDRASQAWTARKRKLHVEFQRVSGFTLVEVEQGEYDRSKKCNLPTRYRVALLPLADETVKRARLSKLWAAGKTREAIKEAAFETLTMLPNAPPIKRRKPKRKPDAAARLARNRKAILTLLDRCRDDLSALDIEAEDFWQELEPEEKAALGICMYEDSKERHTYKSENGGSQTYTRICVPPPLTDNDDNGLQAKIVQEAPEIQHTPEAIAAFDRVCDRAKPKPSLTLTKIDVQVAAPLDAPDPALTEFDADAVAEAEAIRAEACGALEDERRIE